MRLPPRRARLPVALLLAVTVAGCASSRPAASAPAATAPSAAAPSPSASAAPATLAHDAFTLLSKSLGETRRINVYLPPDYEASPGARFPILYMPDGGEAEDFPHVIATIDAGIRAREIRRLIVVGIENTQRRRDMTGPTTVEKDKTIAPHVGGSAAFRAFLRDELMPEIAKRVRGNGKTAIVGESLAGLFVVETFFLEPSLFDTYIAFSPSLWWNDHALVRGADAWLAAHPSLARTFYLTGAGDDDIDDTVKTLGASLKANAPTGLTWFYEPRPEEKHATIYVGASPAVFRKVLAATGTDVRRAG